MAELDKMQKEIFYKEVLNKLARYCAYQERSSGDVLNKLYTYKLPIEVQNEIYKKLEKEGFINDIRYCQSFVNGKLRNNHWGRIKIRLALREKGIETQTIDEAIEGINEEEYRGIIRKLILGKYSVLKDNDFVKKNKTARFLLSKGFEAPIIWEEMEGVIN